MIKNVSFYDLVVYQEALISQQVTELGQEGFKPMSAIDGEAKVRTKMDEWTQADFLYGYQARPNKNLADVVDSIIESGNGIELEPGSVSATGQTTLPGAPKTETTTNPDGTTITKTVSTTNNYTYGPSTTDNRITITQNTTTVNNTTNNTTNQTTTTTTEETKEPDERCVDGDRSVGCMSVDTPQVEVPKSSRDVTYTADDLGLGAGSCPAPITLSTSAGTHTISYAAACDLATNILKPLLLVGAALAAYFIVAGGVRGS